VCGANDRYVATKGDGALKPLPTGAIDSPFITVILAFLFCGPPLRLTKTKRLRRIGPGSWINQMSAPADAMPRNRPASRPATIVATWFKRFFARLYIALDKTQRKRAAEIIHLYSPRNDDSGEHKKEFLWRKSGDDSQQF
jgi:hypothetical protein